MNAYNKVLFDRMITAKDDEAKNFIEKYIPVDEINPYDIVHKENRLLPNGFSCWNKQETQIHEVLCFRRNGTAR